MSTESKKEVAREIVDAMAREEGLRERVRNIVMRAFSERSLDVDAVRGVMREVIEGVGEGMPQRGSQAADAGREAVRGLDEAVGRTVYSLQMALEEVWGQGRQFSETDLKSAVDEIKSMEEDLMSTLKESADKGQGVAKEAFGSLYDHLVRNGTDTGSNVRRVLEILGNRMATAAHGAGSDLKAQGEESATRFKAVASGILRGLADSLESK